MSNQKYKDLLNEINDIACLAQTATNRIEDTKSALNLSGPDLIDDISKKKFNTELEKYQVIRRIDFFHLERWRDRLNLLIQTEESNERLYDHIKSFVDIERQKINHYKRRIDSNLSTDEDFVKRVETLINNVTEIIYNNAVSHLTEINKKYKNINIPNLYLDSWFSDLKRNIDLLFESRKLETMNSYERIELNLNHSKLINEIQKFEKTCYSNRKSKQLEAHATQLDYLNEFSLAKDNKELSKLVFNFKIACDKIQNNYEVFESNIFKNKTIFFLKNDSFKENAAIDLFSQMDAVTTCGRLFLIDNCFVHSSKIFKVFESSSSFILTNELVKLLNLKKEIIKSKQEQITVISLKLNKSDLDLSNSSITTIQSTAFDGFTNLTDLFLNDNSISKTYSDILTQLTSLEWLSLKKNGIDSIELNSFKNLNKLIGLNLSSNRLKQIESDAFTGLYSLKSLNLNDNSIETIGSNVFDNLINLNILNLSHNKIGYLSEGLFKSLTELKELNLNGNKLKFIHKDTFHSLIKLQMLDMSDNLIENIEQKVFQFQNNLIELDLNSNSISSIKTGSFDKLNSLKRLNLGNNLLKQAEPILFSQLNMLKELKIDHKAFTFGTDIYDRLFKNNVLKF